MVHRFVVITVLLLGMVTQAEAQFRIAPYLQNPSSTGIQVTWFSESAAPGTLTLRGPGLAAPRTIASEPTAEPALDYTAAERAQVIAGLPQGSWLLGDANYKHAVVIDGLRPDTRYTYTVQQGETSFTAAFRTAPTAKDWKRIRFVAMADAETEPLGRVQRREWAPGALAAGSLPRPSAEAGGEWDRAFGSTTLSGVRVLRYMLTEDEGYRRNLELVERRDPHFVLTPGDLVQGGGYQPGWDEFFRQNAGPLGTLLSRRAILPALGNWENFGALNGGYGTPADRSAVVRARAKYHVYFDAPPNDVPAHRDNYYRIDYGPVTILTLDSSNGEPDDVPANYPPGTRATGTQYNGPGTDTQSNFTREQYEAAGGNDLADIGPGSAQWIWTEAQLEDARAKGQIVFVQFHHVPYSNGEHGVPMDHALTTGQGGTPMRRFHDMFERHGVAAVFSGHSEMFERSFVDADGDGVGVNYYDVGVSGDGLRGEKRDGNSLHDPPLRYNPYHVWSADQEEPEHWAAVNGRVQLVRGGKHYGHLEVNIERAGRPDGKGHPEPVPPGCSAQVTLTPVHNFPILDDQYNMVRTERRTYSDLVRLCVGADGRVAAPPAPPSR